MSRKSEKNTPYQKNDVLTVTVDDLGSSGEGIGRADGYTLFIRGAVIGDRVKVHIMKAAPSYAFAHLDEILVPSPDRVLPPCPAALQCGGCQIQCLSYEAQLRFKQKKVRDVLTRIGGFSEETADRVLQPIVGMTAEECGGAQIPGAGSSPFRYRNKTQVPIGTKDGEIVSGFYAEHSHAIIPVEDCLLGAEHGKDILRAVKDYMKQYHVSPYDEVSGKGQIRHVLIRDGRRSGEISVCVVANAEKLPAEGALVSAVRNVPGVCSVSLNTNTERTNVILGRKTRTLSGPGAIRDSLRLFDVKTAAPSVNSPGSPLCFAETGKSVTFSVSPLSFYQVNPVQTEKLYSIAADYCRLTGKETVWDLYCGVGTISLFLAGKAGSVYGVEIIPQAVKDAGANASLNHIGNAFFETGRAEDVLPAYYARTGSHPDVVVVDPPRKGLDEVTITTILSASPARIVYVSCDPATLARDLRKLTDGGYVLEKVQPVDQFPHTVHVENVSLLVRK